MDHFGQHLARGARGRVDPQIPRDRRGDVLRGDAAADPLRLDIRPGDTIVAPLHADKIEPITFWSNATQIVYNLAIGAAAVNSF